MTILTPNQKNILFLLAKEPVIADNFYLTGGTALAEFYLGHRLSEDLVFFQSRKSALRRFRRCSKKFNQKET